MCQRNNAWKGIRMIWALELWLNRIRWWQAKVKNRSVAPSPGVWPLTEAMRYISLTTKVLGHFFPGPWDLPDFLESICCSLNASSPVSAPLLTQPFPPSGPDIFVRHLFAGINRPPHGKNIEIMRRNRREKEEKRNKGIVLKVREVTQCTIMQRMCYKGLGRGGAGGGSGLTRKV